VCGWGGKTATPIAHVQTAPIPVVDDSGPTLIAMRNVDFHFGSDVVMHVTRLEGAMRGKGGVVDFDDSRSFVTYVEYAEAALDAKNLTNLFNNHVFNYRGAPLRNIKVEIKDGQIRQSGILHKGVDIPFSMKADVSLTPDGRIRLHPTDTDIFCVDGDKLMQALHLTMQKMVDVSKARGVAIEKNDFIIDAMQILPPPVIRGRLRSVRVVNDLLVQEIGPDSGQTTRVVAQRLVPPDTTVRNYMYYRGGHLRFGRKLLMTDADMQVIDADQANPFDFDLDRYMVQLVAGYSRTLANAGLWVLMPDANRVTRLEMTAGGEVVSARDTACNCLPRKTAHP
jgi:hypothetical protein